MRLFKSIGLATLAAVALLGFGLSQTQRQRNDLLGTV